MTAEPAALLRLATDIETMEGPDREMDARVWCALHPGFERRDGAWVRESGKRWQKASAYTGSVDAALGLLAEVLPGWVSIRTTTLHSPTGQRPSAVEIRPMFDEQIVLLCGEAVTLPLAIVAAVLRAVAQEGSDG